MHLRLFLPLALAALALAVAEPPALTKMELIASQLRHADTHRQKYSFSLSEAELNEYLAFELKQQPRPGVERIQLKLFPHNYVSTFTVVDLDSVQRWRPDLFPSLLRPILRGRQGMLMDVRIQSANGLLRWTVAKAQVNGVPMPASLVQTIMQEVAARQPEHYDLSKPLPLPPHVRRIWTDSRVLWGQN